MGIEKTEGSRIEDVPSSESCASFPTNSLTLCFTFGSSFGGCTTSRTIPLPLPRPLGPGPPAIKKINTRCTKQKSGWWKRIRERGRLPADQCRGKKHVPPRPRLLRAFPPLGPGPSPRPPRIPGPGFE